MTFQDPIFSFAEAGLPMKPDTVFNLWGFTVDSSMIVALAASLLIVALVQVAMRAPKLVPTGLQNFVEFIVESLSNFLEKLLGHKVMLQTFWFFGTIFIFIVGCNLLSLLPGVGTIGTGPAASFWDFRVDHPFFRGANADVNMTAAMSAIFFFLWIYWCLQNLGPVGFIKHTFGSKVHFSNIFANLLFGLIFFFVGCIEVISILVIRPIAFTFRLYGNIFGGEFLLDTIYKMSGPWFAWIALVPCYFYEFLVALIQALVFCMLTAIFTSLILPHDSETDHPA
jgi:F-type H+-transporting ATPase subunit a